jgi:putative oxidoreductase
MQKPNMIAWADSRRDEWLDCIRIYLGIGLVARGLLMNGNSQVNFIADALQRAGYPWLLTGMVLHYVMFCHLVGGGMLAIGFLTRIAALVQIPVLFGAVFMVHRSEGFLASGQSLEFSSLVLFLLGIFLVAGAGRLSLDYYVFGAGAVKHPDSASAVQ